MKKNVLSFPKISRSKQQSIYGANGSGDSEPHYDYAYELRLEGFELAFGSGDNGNDSDDNWEDLGDTFGDDNYSDGYGSGGGSNSNNSNNNQQQTNHPSDVDLHGDDQSTLQSIANLFEFLQKNQYTGLNLSDVFKNLPSSANNSYDIGNGIMSSENVRWTVRMNFHLGDIRTPDTEANELDYISEANRGSEWDLRIMNSGNGGPLVIMTFQSYESMKDFRNSLCD